MAGNISGLRPAALCSLCGAGARVIDVRKTNIGPRRRYACNECDQRFTTYEVSAEALDQMKKESLRADFMALAQQELNTAYTKIVASLPPTTVNVVEEKPAPRKKRAPLIDNLDRFDDNGIIIPLLKRAQ